MSASELLRQAREAKGLSLAAVEQSTKISIRVLKALESGSSVGMPPPIYSRGLIRRYAEFLALDSNSVLSQFNIPEQPDVLPSPVGVGRPVVRRIVNTLTGATLVAAIFVIAGWVYEKTYVERPSPSPIAMPFSVDATSKTGTPDAADAERTAAIVTSRARSAPAGPRSEEEAIAETDASRMADGRTTGLRPMTVDVRAVEPAHVTVSVDGSIVFTGLLLLGDRRTFTAQEEVHVQSSNAGGIEIVRNGQVVGLLGRPFETAERTWTAAP